MMKRKTINIVLYIISIFLISMSIVLSISIWNNRSLFFDELIYSKTNYNYYVKLIYDSIKNDDFTNEKLSDYSFVYYNFFIDGEWYTNLPDDSSVIENKEVISVYVKENVNAKDYIFESNSEYSILNESHDQADEIFVDGYIYIDMSKNLYGPLQFSIKQDLKLQSILYFDCISLLIAISIGLILFLKNFKYGQKYISDKLDFIPIDIKCITFIFLIMLFFIFLPVYIDTFRVFFHLRRRIILFSLSTVLTVLGTIFLLDILCIILLHRNNPIELKNKWDNRYFRNIPLGLSLFLFLITLYIGMLNSFSMFESFINRYFFVRENILVLTIHLLIMIILSIAISRIIKAKNRYINLVVSEIREIAEGNLKKDIAVIGNDKISDIAQNVNLIKKEYIKAIEEQKKSERLKYELITNISHDLRSPLTSIINYLDLSKALASEEKLKRYIDAAESNSKTLHLLIEDLFELSKMESGNIRLTKSNIDLILLLKQVAYEYNIICKKEKKEIVLLSSLSEIQYFCDNLSISRLFNNLIDNAVKYSLPDTRIYIEVSSSDQDIRVEVKNVSSYKLDFDLDELFLRLKRGDKARTTEGSGLGLAISKGIAVLHNGDILLKKDGDLFKAMVILPILNNHFDKL